MICPKCGRSIPTGDQCDYCGYHIRAGFLKRFMDEEDDELRALNEAGDRPSALYGDFATAGYHDEKAHFQREITGDGRAQKKSYKVLMVVLSFFFPPAGLILYASHRRKNRHNSSGIGKAALYGIVFQLLVMVAIPLSINTFQQLFGDTFDALTGRDKLFPPAATGYSADIEIQDFTTKKDSQHPGGWRIDMPMIVKNTAPENRRFVVTVKAYDGNGTHLVEDKIKTDILHTGETAEMKAFYHLSEYHVSKFSTNQEDMTFVITDVKEFAPGQQGYK